MQNLWPLDDNIVRGAGAGIISACLFLTIMGGMLQFLHPLLIICLPLCTVPLFYCGLQGDFKIATLASAIACFVIICTGHLDLVLMYGCFFSLPTLYICHRIIKNPGSNVIRDWLNVLTQQQLSTFIKRLKLPPYFDPVSNPNNTNLTPFIKSGGFVITLVTHVALVVTVIISMIVIRPDSYQIIFQAYKNAQSVNGITLSTGNPDLAADFMMIYRLIPGSFAILFSGLLLIYSLISQYIISKIHKNFKPNLSVADVRLPLWLWVNLVIWIIIASLGGQSFLGQLALNVVLVLLAAFMLQGMSIIYIFCRQQSYKTLWLMGFCLLTLLIPGGTIFVTVIGVFEPWINLRLKVINNFRS